MKTTPRRGRDAVGTVYKAAKHVTRAYHSVFELVKAVARMGRDAGLQPGQTRAALVMAEVPEEIADWAINEVYGEEDPL